ncbi:unnamed protein product [Brassicogethes aeneus]|uniref:DBC1/CARP1 catalytically inactive NUDIX hydrolase domain-containing protein n=1 Tax=Brassicogethes aeneus TaxID=1431903 RepID=A0A9P0FKT1_BRAAE|nr:unnamed protein product [Brassicogethes aeneus]
MNQFSNKTTPWAGSNTSPNLVKQGNSIQSSIINQGLGNINTTGMIQFQQQQPQQCFQNSIGLGQQNISLGLQQIANNAINTANLNSQIASNPLFQVPTVSYPNPRGLNPTAFQTQSISSVPLAQISGTKQRFFTGTVTKVHDNFGFVDEDVFFQTNNCVKGSNPLIGDRVLVEATYNPSMPFKWNATRIQVLPATNQTKGQFNSKNYSNNYKSVPPPIERLGQTIRLKGNICGKGRDLSIERDDEIERKRRRQERVMDWVREEKKSPICRSRSPKLKRRSRIVPRYMVLIPKIALDVSQANVLEIRRRYSNMYIPSDFFISNFRWVDAFPPDQPFTLNKPCLFHIMREIEPIADKDAIIEPPDADYIFSAKVMLMSVPGMEELLKKCCATAEDKDNEEKDFVHPTRLISFLVGLRGKNETMAIGGPWSRSVDGDNPSKDPSVLIKTAIRTCKALTGIDLSSCTQWYRFVELYYRRAESTHKGNYVAARVETVVLFLPDVWSCLPTRLEWDELQLSYKQKLELKLKLDIMAESDDTTAAADEKALLYFSLSIDRTIEEENTTDKCEPTHYSLLDPKSMGIGNLKNELKARNMNYKGLKSQLVARLTKVLKGEMEKTVDEPNTLKESQAIESLMEETKYKVSLISCTIT